ncbi:hypothetical protein J7E34_08345 [Chryseobacterium sp. ISL-80]|nr:hypothetical protein [Chryseobacterium sp. ISL-80]
MVSGIALGLFLKLIQFLTNLKVYTLLLNVDYVPILKNIQLPEIIEFGLHLVISIMLAFILNLYIKRKRLRKEAIHRFVLRVSLIVGLLLYPTTLLSERTPSITDAYAFVMWMAGHWIYGIILARILSHKEGERV